MTFLSREEAGRELGRRLLEQGVKADVVVGLPRGGVVVAAEVAKILQCPLEVLVVRKIGHPRQREFAVGALAEPDVVLLDKTIPDDAQIPGGELQAVITEETERLQNYQAKFHHAGAGSLAGKIVLIVDDGVATGATTEAAVVSARRQKASRIIVTAPVASTHAMDRLKSAGAEVIALVADPDFGAVGQYYGSFPQTTDEEVLALIDAHA
jgi:putative phosphoribosyl transferase